MNLFISGTSTDIGKTYLTATLCRQLMRQKQPVQALKPVISGFDAVEGSDTALLLEALNRHPTMTEIEAISPWRFKASLSPDCAAALEGKSVKLEDVVAFCRSHENKGGHLLVEGAGGVMTPLTQHATMRDFMAALGYPVLLVCGSYLGAVSHTLTAFESLHVLRIPVHAILINESVGTHVTLEQTTDSLRSFLPNELVITSFRRNSDADLTHLLTLNKGAAA